MTKGMTINDGLRALAAIVIILAIMHAAEASQPCPDTLAGDWHVTSTTPEAPEAMTVSQCHLRIAADGELVAGTACQAGSAAPVADGWRDATGYVDINPATCKISGELVAGTRYPIDGEAAIPPQISVMGHPAPGEVMRWHARTQRERADGRPGGMSAWSVVRQPSTHTSSRMLDLGRVSR